MQQTREIAARRPARWRVLAVLCTSAVLVMCFLPGDATPSAPVVNLDKVVHVVAFAAVAFAWRRSGLSATRTLALGLALAVITEVGQSLLQQGRSGDVLDFAADAAGVLLGLLLARGGGAA
ncbi:MAG: VanZ family protein [Planctomycetota bacterium]|nr:VanZ family protein [Planctomycetota bacterium]